MSSDKFKFLRRQLSWDELRLVSGGKPGVHGFGRGPGGRGGGISHAEGGGQGGGGGNTGGGQ